MPNYKTGGGNYRSPLVYTKRQTTTQTVNNSTTLVDTEMVTNTLKVGSSYLIDFYIYGNSGATPDYKFGLTNTGSMAATIAKWDLIHPSATPAMNSAITSSLTLLTSGTDRCIHYQVQIMFVTNDGTLTLSFAQATQTVADTKVFLGSFVTVVEVTF